LQGAAGGRSLRRRNSRFRLAECAHPNQGVRVPILLAALGLFVFVAIAIRRNDVAGTRVQEQTGLVRAITGAVAAAIAAGAALWLRHLTETDSSGLAYLLTAAIGAGAVIYLVGTVLGHGRLALRLRWIGWIAMTAPLLVPSTFSLALPVAAALAVTLRPLPPRPASKQPSSDILVPR
jgi:hypothetical protein